MRKLVCLWMLASPHAALAALACPPEVDTEQAPRSGHPGWVAMSDDTRSPLVSVRFSDGDPKDLAWLLPDKSSRAGVQEWNLLPSPRGYWVVCGYANTRVILARQLAPKVSRCTVTLDRSFTPPVATQYRCQ